MNTSTRNREWLETAFDLYHILEQFATLDLPYTKAYEMTVDFLDAEIRNEISVYITSNRDELDTITFDQALDLFARCTQFYNKA